MIMKRKSKSAEMDTCSNASANFVKSIKCLIGQFSIFFAHTARKKHWQSKPYPNKQRKIKIPNKNKSFVVHAKKF